MSDENEDREEEVSLIMLPVQVTKEHLDALNVLSTITNMNVPTLMYYFIDTGLAPLTPLIYLYQAGRSIALLNAYLEAVKVDGKVVPPAYPIKVTESSDSIIEKIAKFNVTGIKEYLDHIKMLTEVKPGEAPKTTPNIGVGLDIDDLLKKLSEGEDK